jgi:hypothetical protein
MPWAFRPGRWWLGACLLLAALFAGKALFGTSSFSSAPLAKAATAARQPVTQTIETIRVGQRVVAHNPDPDSSVRTANLKVDPATWRFLRLQAEDRWPDGTLDVFEVETLQPAEWVEQHRAKPGATVPLPLDLLEMGVREDLPATVVANEPCPPIPSGAGAVVLTTVNHLNPNVFELTLSGDHGKRDTIRPTGLHKFFSGDRRCWVNTQEVKEGERLRSIDGWLTASSLRRLPGVQRVYNMTVAGEHVYHVSNLGLLSHNNVPCGDGEGIYEFPAAPSGKTYVGQTGDFPVRIQQHIDAGKLLEADLPSLQTTEVLGGKTAREIAEQLRIKALGGVENLENIRNPIGAARQYLLP